MNINLFLLSHELNKISKQTHNKSLKILIYYITFFFALDKNQNNFF